MSARARKLRRFAVLCTAGGLLWLWPTVVLTALGMAYLLLFVVMLAGTLYDLTHTTGLEAIQEENRQAMLHAGFH